VGGSSDVSDPGTFLVDCLSVGLVLKRYRPKAAASFL
jgi:hypothetical protein